MPPELPPENQLVSASKTQIRDIVQILLNAQEKNLDPLVNTLCSEKLSFSSYDDLLAHAFAVVNAWPIEEQEAFVHGHPRIGAMESLAGLSREEQTAHGASPETTARSFV